MQPLLKLILEGYYFDKTRMLMFDMLSTVLVVIVYIATDLCIML